MVISGMGMELKSEDRNNVDIAAKL